MRMGPAPGRPHFNRITMADLRPSLDRLGSFWLTIDDDEAIDLSHVQHVRKRSDSIVDVIMTGGHRVRITDPDQIAGILERVGLA